ncbi:hypothetical protein [Weizmannia acidilactici]|uniref:hypothetical protein n=1 Tax=Weizmannia acidilactici TaxID=2607726 RepID=UPI001276222D|nr:hypothetical protein [Weizmannia acidilactici]GER74615.1 hypothetical protein BpPP18_26820 [Weizmannia acidilactici]
MNEKERRSLNLPLADAGLSNSSKRLRRNNELLLKQLRQIQTGPFGICTWFRKGNGK